MKQIPSTIDGFPNRTQEYSAPLSVFSIFPDEKFLESDCFVTALPAVSITAVFSCTLGRRNDQISLMLSLVFFGTNKNERAFLKTTSPRLLRTKWKIKMRIYHFSNCNPTAELAAAVCTPSLLKQKGYRKNYSKKRHPPKRGFPGDSVVKNLPADVGDAGSIPVSGRSPGRGNGQPTPVFVPGKSHGPRSLAGKPTGSRGSDTAERLEHALTRIHLNSHSGDKLHSAASESLSEPQHLEEGLTHPRARIRPFSREAAAVPGAVGWLHGDLHWAPSSTSTHGKRRHG